MAQGKPTGIRRKSAPGKASLIEKGMLSDMGDFMDHAEASLIKSIIQNEAFTAWLKEAAPDAYAGWVKCGRVSSPDKDKEILDAFKKAVLTLDSGFFQRCQKAVEWLRGGQPVADPMGTKILSVLMSFMRDHSRRDKISSIDVVNELSKRFPREDGNDYDAKDVRAICRGLGLTFPLYASALRRTHLEFLRGRFDDPVSIPKKGK